MIFFYYNNCVLKLGVANMGMRRVYSNIKQYNADAWTQTNLVQIFSLNE